ncbi:autoinducer-2 kinase [Pengzhenrongella frigida]|uniref:Autoinducer-2 kinase n=1 Tax=Pengzhenrongella frigida TaxID=1259133 RepID=A0A4Q5MVZ9_9MICO|nr:autoinducer-2 kinase [Cellulomonas sp. HLT2-17]RYV49776.1 autoinducer-2 kinase [Cellulomonas sp. HLT2-17]
MSHVLAIDAGTGSVRAALFTLEGALTAAASRQWEHDPEPGVPGSMSFATDRNWSLIVECVREALAIAGIPGRSVTAVSASAMREGIVVLDAGGREIWACANVDSRADAEVAYLASQPGLVEKVYRRSGQTFALATQPRLVWLARHRPELYERAHTVLMLSEWVLFRLGGGRFMEPSNGSTSGMLSLASRSADPELATLCGLRPDLLPEVVEPGSAVGRLSAVAAEATGLAEGTTIAVGGGDAQLAALGLGQTEPGQVLLTGGTFWQLNVNMGRPLTHPDLAVRVNAAAVSGLWQAEAIAFHPGTAVRWFRDTFAGPEVAAARAAARNPLDVLTEAAAQVPIGSDGVIPIFSDVMNYRHWTHAAPSFLNLSLDGGPRLRAAMFRSLLENAAIVAHSNLALVSAFTPVADDAPVVFAGGAANSAVWTQIVADVLGRPVRVPVVTEATAQGTAACAAAATGAYATPAEAGRAWVRWARDVEPDAARHEQYEPVRVRWSVAYAAQRELMRAGVTTPMWQAPGS